MTRVLLIDSNVWSHLVLGDADKQAAIRKKLASLLQKYPQSARATSGICVAECLVAARRLADPQARAAAEAAMRAEFDDPQLMVVAVTDAVLDRAATLRAQALRLAEKAGSQAASANGGKLKLPDAIIAASCLEFDPPAILLTENDKDFRYLDNGQSLTVAGLVLERVD
jgi:predicted nucleic acid-binding protein